MSRKPMTCSLLQSQGEQLLLEIERGCWAQATGSAALQKEPGGVPKRVITTEHVIASMTG